MNSIPVRLKAADAGLGMPSQTQLEQRAAELARADGRESFVEHDLQQAAADLSAASGPPMPPETSQAGVADLTSWDDPADQSGHRVAPVPMADEAPVAEQLIHDGLEEADHDTRVAAEDGES